MKLGTYIGDDPALEGKTAAIVADAPGVVLVQFDDTATGLGFGWHRYPASDWEVIDGRRQM